MQPKYPLINFDPIAISIGPLDVHWYGIMYLLAFASFWLIASYRATHQPWWGWTKDQVSDVLFYGMLGVIAGGRIGYMLFYATDTLLANPLTLFRIWDGGMSFHGGLAGVMVASWWFARRSGKTFWQVADFAAPIGPLGLAFGRLGNFIGGELWGRTTDVPWAMIFAKSTDINPANTALLEQAWQSGALDHFARHPSQLYQASLEGLSLFIILMVYSSRPRPTAAVTGLFLLGYGFFRLFVEFFRQPDEQIGFLAMQWLTMGMLLSMPLILGGAIILVWAYRNAAKQPPTQPSPTQQQGQS